MFLIILYIRLTNVPCVITGENKLLNVFGKQKHERYKTILFFPFMKLKSHNLFCEDHNLQNIRQNWH
jgi:hypothetical protein